MKVKKKRVKEKEKEAIEIPFLTTEEIQSIDDYFQLTDEDIRSLGDYLHLIPTDEELEENLKAWMNNEVDKAGAFLQHINERAVRNAKQCFNGTKKRSKRKKRSARNP